MQRLLLVKAANDFPAMTFPLGLMYLSAVLRQVHPDVPIQLYDLRLRRASMEDFQRTLETFRPTVVGISFISVEIDTFAEVARRVKAFDPDIPVIVGGPHPSSDPLGTLGEHPEVDFAAVGEGEETFLEWWNARSGGRRDYSDIAGLYWRTDDGKVVANPPRNYIREIDELPHPDYDLIHLDDYWKEWSMGDTTYRRFHRYANLFTSRACPYKCTYCHDVFGKGFRAMTPRRVVEEMEWMQRQYGVEEFEIIDDIFNFNADRLKEICRLIVERGLGIRLSFPNGLRTDRLDAEQIDWLKRAGTRFVAVAIETATPRLQKQIRKNLKVDYVFGMIDELHRQGIFTRGYFMLGFPSETHGEIRATIDFALRSRLTTANFFIVVPYKGTRIEEENKELVDSLNIEYGKIDYWTNRYNMSAVTNVQLKRLQRYATLAFYLNPRRLSYIYRRSPSPGRFLFYGFCGFWVVLWRALSKDRPNYFRLQQRVKTRLLAALGLRKEAAA